MTRAPFATAEKLLERVLRRTDDEDARFELRTALQLVVVAREDHERARETIDAADLDGELRDRLQELGYLE